MEWWKVIIIFAMICLLAANIGVTFFIYCQKESSCSKEPGYRLKKARNKVIKRINDNYIKNVIKECSKAYKNGCKYYERLCDYNGFSIVKEALETWLITNNISYSMKDVDTGLGKCIHITFNEGEKICY